MESFGFDVKKTQWTDENARQNAVRATKYDQSELNTKWNTETMAIRAVMAKHARDEKANELSVRKEKEIQERIYQDHCRPNPNPNLNP